jgi:hypothetical protein
LGAANNSTVRTTPIQADSDDQLREATFIWPTSYHQAHIRFCLFGYKA